MRLVDSNGRRGHYICLSHRWMDPEHMPRCTQSNVASLKKCIPWSWITSTFQDAIIFAKYFAHWHASEYPDHDLIEHIWIDSLCIIQDSAEDWENQSKLMCSVYEGAILTVAAAAGTSGCFSTADPAYSGLAISDLQYAKARTYIREALPNHTLDFGHQADSSELRMSSFDLLNRGWVLQERFCLVVLFFSLHMKSSGNASKARTVSVVLCNSPSLGLRVAKSALVYTLWSAMLPLLSHPKRWKKSMILYKACH
jgi:hypothetical protein